MSFDHVSNVHGIRNDILRPELRPDWDHYFLVIADAVSRRADCRRRTVGCVIVDEDHRVLATGYNGSQPGGPSCLAGQCPRGLMTYEQQPGLAGSYDGCVATHAELNALLFARASCKGATVYITCEPCRACEKSLLSASVKRVVWLDENDKIVDNFPMIRDVAGNAIPL